MTLWLSYYLHSLKLAVASIKLDCSEKLALEVELFWLMERHCSWDWVLTSFYRIDAHDVKNGNPHATRQLMKKLLCVCVWIQLKWVNVMPHSVCMCKRLPCRVFTSAIYWLCGDKFLFKYSQMLAMTWVQSCGHHACMSGHLLWRHA